MKTIAAANEARFNAMFGAFLSCVHQVARDLCLAVDHDLSARQFREIDVDEIVAIGEIKAVVQKPLRMHTSIQPQALHQFYGDALKESGAYSAEDVFGSGVR